MFKLLVVTAVIAVLLDVTYSFPGDASDVKDKLKDAKDSLEKEKDKSTEKEKDKDKVKGKDKTKDKDDEKDSDEDEDKKAKKKHKHVKKDDDDDCDGEEEKESPKKHRKHQQADPMEFMTEMMKLPGKMVKDVSDGLGTMFKGGADMMGKFMGLGR